MWPENRSFLRRQHDMAPVRGEKRKGFAVIAFDDVPRGSNQTVQLLAHQVTALKSDRRREKRADHGSSVPRAGVAGWARLRLTQRQGGLGRVGRGGCSWMVRSIEPKEAGGQPLARAEPRAAILYDDQGVLVLQAGAGEPVGEETGRRTALVIRTSRLECVGCPADSLAQAADQHP